MADSGVFLLPPLEDCGCRVRRRIAGGLMDGLDLSYPQSQGRRQSSTATIGSEAVSSMGYRYDTYARIESLTKPVIGTNGLAAVFG